MPTDRPDHCEIPGCKTLFCGTTPSGTQVFKCGKADIFITQNDRIRGVCQRHYAEITDRDGTSRMAELKDAKGNFDPVKVAAFVPNDAQGQLPIRSANPVGQSIGDLVADLAIDDPDNPPDWFGDRP